MHEVKLNHAFETSKEELQNSDVVFIQHDPELSAAYNKWVKRHEMWYKYVKETK